MIQAENIGGAVVRRTFKLGDKHVFSGHPLTRDQVLAIPVTNRRALVEKGQIEIFPRPQGWSKHVVSTGFGRYDVIEGLRINSDPLTREEAYALAGVQAPAETPQQLPQQPTGAATRQKGKTSPPR
jgi:hypothetical protein